MENTEIQTYDQADQAKPVESTTRVWRKPYHSVEEDQEGFTVSVNIPGASRDSIEIKLEGDVLTLEARKENQVPKAWKVIRSQLSRADYKLAFRLDGKTDRSNISAKLSEGVLSLRLPKNVAAMHRKIEVN